MSLGGSPPMQPTRAAGRRTDGILYVYTCMSMCAWESGWLCDGVSKKYAGWSTSARSANPRKSGSDLTKNKGRLLRGLKPAFSRLLT